MARRLIAALLGVLATALVAGAAAGEYPARPVRWIVAFPPGGSNDVVARLIAQGLSDRLRQPFIIENKSGASGNIGTEAALRSAPDGYTLLFSAPHNAINATLYPHLPFSFPADVTAIGGLARTPNVMEVNPSVPAKDVREFVAYAKSNPGKVNMASPGNGTAIHLAGELFTQMTGTQLVHVPYRGGAPALTDLMSGHVQVMFDSLPSSLGHIQSGELRALGVTTVQRSPTLPNLPTVAETVTGYEASIWYGVVGPKGVSPQIVAVLNNAINETLADPSIQKRLATIGCSPMPLTVEEFKTLLTTETLKWAEVVQRAHIAAE